MAGTLSWPQVQASLLEGGHVRGLVLTVGSVPGGKGREMFMSAGRICSAATAGLLCAPLLAGCAHSAGPVPAAVTMFLLRKRLAVGADDRRGRLQYR